MKNNQILAALTGVFFLCAVFTMYKTWTYHLALRQLSVAQARANQVRGKIEPMLVSLMRDTTEYSKKNPAILPILQALTNNLSRPMPVEKPPGK